MSAYKQFLASDIIVSPLEVNKNFTFRGESELTDSNVGINRFLGQNSTSSLFNISDSKTGASIGTEYSKLIYNSIKQLYYSDYLTSVYGDEVNRAILIPGRDSEGDRYIGSASNQAYYNYLQTNLTYPRYFPTNTSSYVGVLSIPAAIFGDYIQPHSFYMSFPSGTFTDDGQGNIITGSSIVGNIIYTHGIITLTGNEAIYNIDPSSSSALYSSSIYGAAIYGTVITPGDWENVLFQFSSSNNFTCSFSSSYIIYETQYKCTIRENEFNFTLNPSTIKNDSTGSVYGYVTESYFSPYITTVGLYDEKQNLLAVGKLSQPLPSSPTTDTTILINLDR